MTALPVAGQRSVNGFLGLIHITPGSEIVSVTADLALFAVLFTDGMYVSFPKLRTQLVRAEEFAQTLRERLNRDRALTA